MWISLLWHNFSFKQEYPKSLIRSRRHNSSCRRSKSVRMRKTIAINLAFILLYYLFVQLILWVPY